MGKKIILDTSKAKIQLDALLQLISRRLGPPQKTEAHWSHLH